MQLESTLTCPECGHQMVETMPTDACQFVFDRKGCGKRLKPRAGDCCVFCSFGSVPCPPIQAGGCCSWFETSFSGRSGRALRYAREP